MKKNICLLAILLLAALKVLATGEPSTYFNIYVPPNNDPVKRDVCLIVTAIYDSTTFIIRDDSTDGDTDDSKSGMLMAGQSYILYIRDNGINDDAKYASGGVLKADGDYFIIRSNKLVYASQSTNSDWQHDWVPSINKSSRGEKFIIYAPQITSSKRDLNVFAYDDSTYVTIRKISKSATTVSGLTNVDIYNGSIVSQRMLNRGQDLIYTYTDGRDVMISGETYMIECSKASTVQYGALWGNERDGGGYVPSANGSSSGELFYFAVPYQSGTTGEQEIRIVSWDDSNQVILERYSAGSWVAVKSWNMSRLKAADWVGRNNGNVNYATVFRLSCSSGRRVSVFEGNWFETGSPGTSDMATMVSAENGTSAGTRFLTYMAPPGNESNVMNPFTGQLFGQRLTHVYMFTRNDTAHVTVKDAYNNGSDLSRTYTILPGRYVDCYLTETEWKNIYNGTSTTAGGPERPYLLIESDYPISVMNTNFNDNWMMYFGSSQEQSFRETSSASSSVARPGDTVVVTANIILNANTTVSNVDAQVITSSGLNVISSTFINTSTNTSINGTVSSNNNQSVVTFTGEPNLQQGNNYQVQTVVVPQVNYNTGGLVPNSTVMNVETIVSGVVNGTPEQAVSTEGISINSSNTSNMMFSPYNGPSFRNDSTDSWTCSCVDMDNDGWDDVFFTERDKTKLNLLYKNNANGSFTKLSNTSLNSSKNNSTSNTWADIDNDGDIDPLVVNNTQRPNNFFLNNGNFSFGSNTQHSFAKTVGYYHGAAWADYDNDGYVDLFMSNYMPTRFNELHHNNGDGSFSLMNEKSISTVSSSAVGSSWADYDNDGFPDLFIPNNMGGKNLLYHNKGNGEFELIPGVVNNEGGYSVGSCWGDIDRDGDLDLFVSNASDRNNYLYRNNGNGTFDKVSNDMVVNDKGHSHGCSFVDVDNDADLDLYVSNDRGLKFLYLNDGSGNFSKKTNEYITANFGKSFGHSWCDIDHDGDLDLFAATHSKEPNHLFLNNGNSKHWVNIKLSGTISNRSAIGSRIYVKCNGHWQMREVNSQSGFGGQSSLRQHFGLGTATVIDSIKIKWNSGLVEYYSNVNADQFLSYTENAAASVSGFAYYDMNNNCQYDSAEKKISKTRIQFSNGQCAYTNTKGEFKTHLLPGTYTASVTAKAGLAVNCAARGISISSSSQSLTNQSLPAFPTCTAADMDLGLGSTALRVGFKNHLKISVHNKGMTDAGAYTLQLICSEALVFKNANSSWNSYQQVQLNGKTYNQYEWNLSGLSSAAELTLDITDSVSRLAAVGSAVKITARLLMNQPDCDSSNNILDLQETLVGAIDPNEKYVFPEGYISQGQKLTYKIAFENVGNYYAENIEVLDRLHPALDISTLKMLSSSHPVSMSVEGREMRWYFEGINLPDSGRDNELCHGYIYFSVMPMQGLPSGTVISNTAAIRFDYCDYIQTGTVSNTLADESVKRFSLRVYPNPVADQMQIKAFSTGFEVEMRILKIYNLLGEELREFTLNGQDEAEIYMSGLRPGAYTLLVSDSMGRNSSVIIIKK